VPGKAGVLQASLASDYKKFQTVNEKPLLGKGTNTEIYVFKANIDEMETDWLCASDECGKDINAQIAPILLYTPDKTKARQQMADETEIVGTIRNVLFIVEQGTYILETEPGILRDKKKTTINFVLEVEL
jgi:hypothetical protein